MMNDVPPATTMADVARVAEVAISTVSRVLSGRGDLPLQTRIRVQAVAQQLGYHRSSTSRGRPIVADSHVVELVLARFEDRRPGPDPYMDEILAGATRSAASAGYELLVSFESDEPADDWPLRVAARRSSGVVLSLIKPTPRQLADLIPLNIPVVLLDPRSDVTADISSVGATNEQGGYDAGAHLVGTGLKRFVVVAGKPRYRTGRAREAGFRRAVAELAPSASVLTVEGSWIDENLASELQPALDRLPLPVGVFACNDAMALGVYRAAEHLGLSIPEDLSVVGFDDEVGSSTLVPPLTTVRQSIRTMAARAVELVHLQRTAVDPGAHRVELPTRLVVRESTRPIPAR